MSEHKTTSPEKQLALEAIATKFSGENSFSQRSRLLEALSRFSVSTYEAMRYLDIYDPRPRIHELRHQFGYAIKTLWQTVVTESGEKHRIGLYVLEGSVNQISVKS
jgi:Helix-turn-helix domain